MNAKYFILTFMIISLIMIIPTDNSQKLDIVGSSSVQPICEQLVETYMENNTNIDINVQGGGSSLGIKSTAHNIADIGMSSKEIGNSNLTVHEIGREGIAIVVNPQNPINDLSKDQVKNIFSGNLSNWEDGSKINVIVREEGSGTLDVFKEIIMDTTPIKKDAIVQNSAGSIKHSIMQDKNAIGFVSLCHLDSDVKSLSIDGVMPCEESIKNNTYSLQRPFIFLTNSTPSFETLKFINWTKTDEAKEILAKEKIITVD